MSKQLEIADHRDGVSVIIIWTIVWEWRKSLKLANDHVVYLNDDDCRAESIAEIFYDEIFNRQI